MKIHGFQKLTLLDYPGMTACTLFFAGCNFRCPFCHNAPLVTDIDNSAVYDEAEVLSFLERRQGILDGVCITGGEPLMQPELPSFIAKVKALGYKVKLDTNGSAPEKLSAMIDSGLIDYVAMDIKNCKEKFCTRICPANVYEWIEKENTLAIRYENCLECGACADQCPVGAISAE